MERLIQLDNLNMQEALRYLGSGGQTPDSAFMALMKDCEKTVLAQARPRYVYRILISANAMRVCVQKARILYCAAIP